VTQTRLPDHASFEDGLMSFVVNAARLRLEIARCGWNAVILAHEARLSPVSVSAALARRPIAATSLSLMRRR
jgi:hypothetical protein